VYLVLCSGSGKESAPPGVRGRRTGRATTGDRQHYTISYLYVTLRQNQALEPGRMVERLMRKVAKCGRGKDISHATRICTFLGRFDVCVCLAATSPRLSLGSKVQGKCPKSYQLITLWCEYSSTLIAHFNGGRCREAIEICLVPCQYLRGEIIDADCGRCLMHRMGVAHPLAVDRTRTYASMV